MGRDNKKIDISIIIPIFNTAEYLSTCLDSIFSQTIKNIEVICIDDGSTDDSLNILNKYKDKYENLIILQQNHRGAGAARNYGMSKAKGVFVAFMDSDDFYFGKNVLKRLYNAAIDYNALVCGGSFVKYFEGDFIDKFEGAREKLKFHREEFINYIDYQCCFGFTRFLINFDFLKEKGIVFPCYQRNEDPPFLAKVLSEAERFYTIPDTIYVARYTDKQIIYNDNMLCDIAEGFKEVLSLANKKKYLTLWKDILIELQKFDIRFSLSIYNGNIRLLLILSEIQDMIRYQKVSELIEYEKKYYEILSKYQKIIIYGAGNFAKEIYDYIINNIKLRSINFAVTNLKGFSTARGLPIQPLSYYINDKKDTLVVIAVKSQKQREEMMQYAQKLGFKNILIIDKLLFKISYKYD